MPVEEPPVKEEDIAGLADPAGEILRTDEALELTASEASDFSDSSQNSLERAEIRQSRETGLIEPRSLAKSLSVTGVTPEVLNTYLDAKKDLFGTNPKELTQNLLLIESRLIAPLIQKLQLAKIPLEQQHETIESAREAFYGIVLNERLSAEQILNIFNGEIIVRDTPGAEIDEKYRLVDIYSYIAYNATSRKFDIYIYNKFFKEKGADKAFLLRHEFAHAAAYSIWGKRYTDFLEAAKNPHSALDSFDDQPELREVLSLIANPRTSKLFFRGYISELLEASTQETDPAKIMELRTHAAQEIVADLTAHFLEGSASAAALIDFRSRYFGYNDEQLFDMILKAEGVQTKEKLAELYEIPDSPTPAQVVKALSQSDNLAALFRISDVWQDKLSAKLSDTVRRMNLVSSSATLPEANIPAQNYTKQPEEVKGAPSEEDYVEAETQQKSETDTSGQTQSVGTSALELWDMFTK